MAKRPRVFDQEAFEESLRRQGCAVSFVKPISSDFKLFVPIVIRHLGPERLPEVVNAARDEFGLAEQAAAWQEASKYIVGWAHEQLAQDKTRRL